MVPNPSAVSAKRSVAEDAVEGGAIAQPKILRPRARGVKPGRESRPLPGLAERRARRQGPESEDGGSGEVEQQSTRSCAGARQGDQREGGNDRHQLAQQPRPRGGVSVYTGALATWLLDRPHPERERQAGQADREERDLPGAKMERRHRRVRIEAVPSIDDQTADQEAHARAEEPAAMIERQRGGAQAFREDIEQHRVRRGRQGRLADADADAIGRERREAARGAAHRGHQAPAEEPDRDHVRAHPAVRQPAERDAEHDVKDRERGAVEKADARVAQAEVALDVLGHDGKDVAVDVVEQMTEDQQGQGVPRRSLRATALAPARAQSTNLSGSSTTIWLGVKAAVIGACIAKLGGQP